MVTGQSRALAIETGDGEATTDMPLVCACERDGGEEVQAAKVKAMAIA
jgi:hypothetical protein